MSSSQCSRSLLFLLFVRMIGSYRLHGHVTVCPHDDSIEGLVSFCSDVITTPYDVIGFDSLSDEQMIVNSTCLTYRERTSCYKRLLHHCQTSNARVSNDLRMIIDRLSIYSKTCLHDLEGGIQLVRCYDGFSRQIRTCSQAFDAFYPLYVSELQSRSACRVLNSAINCLLQIEQEMREACSDPAWSRDFHMAYIGPLVHRSQNSSHRIHCTIPSHLRTLHFPSASLSCSARTELDSTTKLIIAMLIVGAQ